MYSSSYSVVPSEWSLAAVSPKALDSPVRPHSLYYDGKPVRFSVVASWIRMADKYKMHRILDHALARLRSFFSDDASQWRDALRNHASRSIKVNAEDAIAAVKLARLTGTFSLLPTALYTCSQLSSPTLLFGVFRDDTSGTVEKLAEDDIVRCLDAREALTRLNLLSTFQVWNPRVSHMCMDTVNCLATFEHQTRAIREGSVVHQYTLSATIREVIGDVCLCVACEEMLRKRLERAQRRHWAELPHMFDLGLHISGWDDRVGGTVAATDNDSYAGDELDNAPEEAERTDFGEVTQDAGLQDADKTVPEGALDEEQTDADTYTTVEIGEESKDEDSDVPGSDDERAHFRVYTSDEEEQAVASQTSDDESPFRAEFRTP